MHTLSLRSSAPIRARKGTGNVKRTWTLDATDSNCNTTSIPLPGGCTHARFVKNKLEGALYFEPERPSFLFEALELLTVSSMVALRASGMFSVEDLYDTAPILFDLSVYRESLLKNPHTRAEAIGRTERLERLLLRDLRWWDWRTDNPEIYVDVIVWICKAARRGSAPLLEPKNTLLEDLIDFLNWLREFPEIPNAVRDRLDAIKRHMGVLRRALPRAKIRQTSTWAGVC